MCLESGKRKHQIKNLENRRTLYDTMALALALLPMLFIWPTLVTAPLTLFTVIRYWKAPSSIVQRTKLRFVLAGLLATAQMVAWAIFFVS
jgi:hypothetical protein